MNIGYTHTRQTCRDTHTHQASLKEVLFSKSEWAPVWEYKDSLDEQKGRRKKIPIA